MTIDIKGQNNPAEGQTQETMTEKLATSLAPVSCLDQSTILATESGVSSVSGSDVVHKEKSSATGLLNGTLQDSCSNTKFSSPTSYNDSGYNNGVCSEKPLNLSETIETDIEPENYQRKRALTSDGRESGHTVQKDDGREIDLSTHTENKQPTESLSDTGTQVDRLCDNDKQTDQVPEIEKLLPVGLEVESESCNHGNMSQSHGSTCDGSHSNEKGTYSVPEEDEKDVEAMQPPIDESGVPVDRGWAIVVCAACFAMHIIVVGGIKSFSVLFVEIQDVYGITAKEMSIAQGVAMTLLMGLGFVANILSNKLTTRVVVFTGGLLAGTGFILTAFVPSYDWIYFTYSSVSGIGFAMSYSPCVVMVGHHFKKYRSLANGLAVSGSGIGSFILPNLIRLLLNEYGLQGCLLLLGALMYNVCVVGLLMRPLSSYKKESIGSDTKRKKERELSTVEEEKVFIDSSETKYTNPTLADTDDGKYVHGRCDDVSHSYEDVNSTSSVVKRKKERSNLAAQMNSQTSMVLETRVGRDGRYKSSSSLDVVMLSLQSLPEEQDTSLCSCCKKTSRQTDKKTKKEKDKPPLFDWALLNNSVFLLYALSCFFANFGYPNIFLMLPAHAEETGVSRDMSALLVSIIGITDLTGRIFFGWFSDLDCVPRRYGFIGCMALSGALNLVLPWMTSFPAMAAYAALYGFFAGSFVALIAVMLADALGPEKLGSSFGLTALFMAVSLMVSPPICGELRDTTNSWVGGFIFAGVATLIGSALPLFVPCATRREERKQKAKLESQME